MHRKLLIHTTWVLAIGASVAFLYTPKASTPLLNTDSFVTVGNTKAPVHMVLFEEFSCVACQQFHQESLPIFYQEYIDKGLMKLTTIPVAYLKESTPAFIASCCMADEGQEHYTAFLEHIFSLPQDKLEQSSPRELIHGYLTNHQELPSKRLLNCVRSEKAYETLETNLKLSDDLPGHTVEMPTLLINGRFVKDVRFDKVKKVIQEELQKASIYVEAT